MAQARVAGPGVHLTDFGLARAIETGSHLTRTGQALGTPAYMSPEQARGEVAALTPATDVWSLGCLLYELLAGRPAFEGSSPGALIARVLTADPPGLRRVRPDLPGGVAQVVQAALAKAPDRRPATAAALRDDLDRILRGEAPRSRAPTRRQWPVGLALLAAAAVVVAGLTFRPGTAPDRPPPEVAADPLAERAERAWATRHADPVAAEAALAAALAGQPGRADWRLRHGLLLWWLDRGAEAQSAFAAVPEGAPEGLAARLYAGLEFLFRWEGQRLRGDLADPYLRQAARRPGAVGRLAQAALALAAGDDAAARPLLEGMDRWEAALLRALVDDRARSSDPTDRLREYERVMRDGIPFPWVVVNLAAVRTLAGDRAGAAEAYESVLRRVPDFPPARHGRAALRREAGDLAGARADLDVALAGAPGEAEYWVTRGDVRRAAGDLAGTVADFTRALELEPDDPVRRSQRGLAHVWAGQPEAARADLAALRARPATTVDDHLARARLAEALGDLAEALPDFEAALALRPADPMLLLAVAETRLEMERAGDAIAAYDALLAREPGHIRALLGRGEAHRMAGQPAGAAADARAVLALDGRNFDAHVHLGLALAEDGDMTGGLASLRAALALAPDPTRLPMLRRYIAEMEAALREGGG